MKTDSSTNMEVTGRSTIFAITIGRSIVGTGSMMTPQSHHQDVFTSMGSILLGLGARQLFSRFVKFKFFSKGPLR